MIMAILVDSPPLFYMVTAVIATLGAAAIQAYLAVRYLRFERTAPPAAQVGEPVTVEITVWSERRIMRPLVTVIDGLPRELVAKGVRPSLPVAPSFDQPIQSRYTFKPMRRGRYKWSALKIKGTDALGLVTRERVYDTDEVNLTVYPAPIPVSIEITPMAGYGASDLETGRARGAGLEPRGIREYASGDPLRYVHWPSSARSTKLMVKEFETGTGVHLNFIIQRTTGTEISSASSSSLEAMCGHALYLAEKYMQLGATVMFPTNEDPMAAVDHPEARIRDIREILTDISASELTRISDELIEARKHLVSGATVAIFVGAQDEALPPAILSMQDMHVICLIYDLNEYAAGARLPSDVKPASETEYLAQLESAGAEVVMMPMVTELK